MLYFYRHAVGGLAAFLFIAVLFLTGCASQKTEKTVVNVGMLKGPTGMSMAPLMEQNEQGKTAHTYHFQLAGTPDEITGKLISGELDAAALPSNLASVLYNKTQGEIKVAAVTTLGVIYILENGNTIQSVTDLKGKTVYATGQASVPEYALQYILQSAGLNEDDVTVEYKAEHGELAALMASGDAALGMLPQPHVTTAMMKNENLRIALDLTEEWDKAAKKNNEENNALVMGCLVVREEFLSQNKEAFDVFMDEYKQSSAYAGENIDDTATLVEKFEIIPQAAIAQKALPYCSIVFLEGGDMQSRLEGFYQTLLKAEPKSIGGALPDENFYYKK